MVMEGEERKGKAILGVVVFLGVFHGSRRSDRPFQGRLV